MAEFSKSNIIYIYDGAFEGFLCCVFESFTRKEIPSDILSQKDAHTNLLEQFNITTDIKKANRVKKSIPQKMGFEAFALLENTLLTCLKHKEMFMLDFMRLGYKAGSKITNMLDNNTVMTLTKAVKQMANEVNKFTGFIRFSVHGDLLISKIKPKNYVLRHIAPHFAARMPNEKFVIFDETHNMICAYAKGRYAISEISGIELPKADNEEQRYRNLWKMFHDTIAIKTRKHPNCQMTLMPKRYRSNMTEFQP
ncbi:MAG: TIGR03915 family putative DNA repair protein [Endomicrobium sp.]|jgi:probable DNA metabolism protein|nr:TIGR03915 family putative DNA repair protein [Endomicrobium sp.]